MSWGFAVLFFFTLMGFCFEFVMIFYDFRSFRPSAGPSRFVSHFNSNTYLCIFSKLCRDVYQVMGVCCMVFYFDWMNYL